jgi:tetratricopeptide (TPR) repeat protein
VELTAPGFGWLLRRIAIAAFAAFAAMPSVRAAADALDDWDIPVTSGAAPGYVPDNTCAMCHSDKAESFAEMGMAKSFYSPGPDVVIEDFDQNSYYHAPSDRHYEMQLRDGEYWFRRFQLASDGLEINVFEQQVDWILGSGHHSRVYLYQTADGALFQLPLAWYTQDGRWAMAPGFEFEMHLGVNRLVRRRCMFCHNGFPDVGVGSDRFEMPELFPRQLPEGIGCQRCHGPGARHVELAINGEVELKELHGAIVNPGKLERERLYSICYGCHMQPNVAVPAERRFGRDAYSFRPGQRLADYVVQMEIDDANRPREERFEINHHPYRLEQSRCFTESQGELGCLTCHDPHVKIKPEERAAHYRQACLSCHETDDGGLPVMQVSEASHPAITEEDDCTACHMPARRTQDVIDVWMTDHRIVADPGPEDLLAPIEKVPATVTGVRPMEPKPGDLDGDLELVHTTMAILHYTSWSADYAAEALRRVLERDPGVHFEPWLTLGKSLVTDRRYAEAAGPLLEADRLVPGHPEVRELLALARFGAGNREGGIATLEELLETDANLVDARYNMAVLRYDSGDLEGAIDDAHAALRLRDNHWTAWRLIGDVERERGNLEEAASAYAQALAIEPAAPRPREGLIAVLEELGREKEAQRYRN